MTAEMARLVARHGGTPVVAPALREVPREANAEAFAFGDRLLAGTVDVVLLLTGVGTRQLVAVLEAHHTRARLVEALGRTTLVARGPKPVKALAELGLRPAVAVPEPNTWRDLLDVLDARVPVAGRRVAVQEYGVPNEALYDGLAERGADVLRVPVYRWALPEDPGPLRAAVGDLVDGRADVVLFTNAAQVSHAMQVAQAAGLGRALRLALGRVAVFSIGPTTSEGLCDFGLPVDGEPEHPKMGHLVAFAAARARTVLAAKRSRATATVAPPPDAGAGRARLAESLFLRACRREATPVTPVWLMRQAGRYMKEYRTLREQVDFLELCRRPDLAAEVTVNAVERLGVDAAILFSDLLVVAEPLGFPVEYTRGEGPVVARPIRRPADVDRLVETNPAETLGFVFEAVRLSRAALPPDVPLIGFAGAPFTLASYLIEGEGSRTYAHTKAFMYRDAGAWAALMERLVATLVPYLNGQIAAGVQAVQLFDSWVGTLSPADYRIHVLPHVRRLIAALDPSAPVIHFGTQTAGLLEAMREAGGHVIGLDWRVSLAEAWRRLGDVAVQGNLDPAVLLAPPAEIRAQAQRVLDEAGGRPGHVFNLGHGILPGTPVDHVRALVDAVHELSARAC